MVGRGCRKQSHPNYSHSSQGAKIDKSGTVGGTISGPTRKDAGVEEVKKEDASHGSEGVAASTLSPWRPRLTKETSHLIGYLTSSFNE